MKWTRPDGKTVTYRPLRSDKDLREAQQVKADSVVRAEQQRAEIQRKKVYGVGMRYGAQGYPLDCNPYDQTTQNAWWQAWTNGCTMKRNERRLAGETNWDTRAGMPWYEQEQLRRFEAALKTRSKANPLAAARRRAGIAKPHPRLDHAKTTENHNTNQRGYALGRNWVSRGYPRDSNPFHPEDQQIEHDAFDRGWTRDLRLGVKICTLEQLHPRDRRVIDAYTARKGWKSLLPFYKRTEP